MVLGFLVFLLSTFQAQIIALEDKYSFKQYHSIIACLETDCSDDQQTSQMYTYDSNRLGDLTNKQFTLQCILYQHIVFVKLNSQVQTSFIAQVQTELYQLLMYQSSTNNITINNTYIYKLVGLVPIQTTNTQYIQFKTDNWLSIYITNKSNNHTLYLEVIVYDFSSFSQVMYMNFIFNTSTIFKLFHNGTEHWQGQGCCVVLYLGLSYQDSYTYPLYNNIKPEAKLLINIQQEDMIQYIVFDQSDYNHIIRLGEQFSMDKFDPMINTDNLQFSSTQYIYANDIQLSQQFSMEFRIALSAYFTSHIVLLNYSQPNSNLYVFLNQTQVILVQDNFTQIFILQTGAYYHFCIAVIQNLEESNNYYNISFYQFSDKGTILSTINIQAYLSQKIPYQTNGVIQLGSKESNLCLDYILDQFQIGEYFQLYHFRFYDGFFLDTNKLIDPNCAVYLNDRCIICIQGLLLSDQHVCQSVCTSTPALTIYSTSHNQCIRQCKAQCATCNSSAQQTCLTCYGIRTTPPYCSCPIGYVDDYSSPNCRQYIPERSTQTGTLLLLCDRIYDKQQTISFSYKYTIIPKVGLFLIGASQLNFKDEINLYLGQVTVEDFQVTIKCSFLGQYYKVQWMSSLENHLLYQEGSQSQQPQASATNSATDTTNAQVNQAFRVLQASQIQYSYQFSEQQINMIVYPQILGWAQSSNFNQFQLNITQTDITYQIAASNTLQFVKYSTLQSDFLSYNYDTKIISQYSSIQIQLQTISKSIKFVNIFQGLQKQNTMGNFSLNFKSRNSTFLNFSSTNQSDILQGVLLFAAIKCDYCTFKGLYLTSCNLNYSQCSCNEPNYYINQTNFCDQCDPNCYECVGTSTNCTSCYSWEKKLVINGSCVCLASQFFNGTCVDCHKNCLTCSGSSNQNCTSCMSPKTFNINLNSCECPLSQYLDNLFSCQQCNATCSSCTDGSSCTSCAINRVLTQQSNKYVCPCISGYYEQDTQCMQCSIQCSECLVQTICTSCPTTRELIVDQCVCKTQFYEINQKECQQCPHLCQTCISDTQCIQCLGIENLVIRRGECICDDGYYLNKDNKCIACKAPCKYCSDSIACTACYEDRELVGTSCLCLDTTYENDNMECQKCQQPCVDCTNPGTICLSCEKGRYLLNNICYCNQGYFENANGQCQACMDICVECLNESSCTKCPVNRVLDQCKCEDGFYEEDQQCNICPKQCLTCNELQKCTSCKNIMELINNECICLKGTYNDGSNCLSCNTQQGLLQKSCDMIKNCGDGIQSANEECDDGNLMNRDGCSDCKIDSGYQCQIKLLQQSFCYKCQEKCRKCTYINYNIVCSECIDGYFIQNNNCIQCSQNCKYCISFQVCTECPIIGTIPDQDGKCPQCQIGEQLQEGICRTICGDGLLGQGEACDFGLQNGQGGCSQDCLEQRGFNCEDNVCNKIPEKFIEASYVNTTTKTLIQINYDLKANELLCQSFQIRIDNFTLDEFNYTFTIDNEQCNFQFNYKKTITESNLIRIIVPQIVSRFLDNDPREIVIIPRRQIYYSEQQVEQSKNVQSAQNQFKLLLQLLGPLLAFLGGFSYYLTILDILSWINNLYYINIQFPLNVQLIFQNSLWEDIQLFPSSALPQFNQPQDPYYRESPPHFLEKGTDPLFINNTYQTFGLLASLIIGHLIAQIVIKTLSRKTYVKKTRLQLQKIGTEQQYLQSITEQKLVSISQQTILTMIVTRSKFFVDNTFSYFIKLLNLCYLDLVSAIVLQLYCFDLSQLEYKMILINYILAYTSLILCLYLLRLTWKACNQDLTLLKNKKFLQIYGTLFENLNIDDQQAILYSFINLSRKTAYIITVVYFYNKPLFQTAFSCLISFINVAFIICYNPFDSVQTSIHQGVPDLCIFLLMLVFTICAIDDKVSVLSDNFRYNLGWLIISIILISIQVQLYFIFQQLMKDLTDRAQKLASKIKKCL